MNIEKNQGAKKLNPKELKLRENLALTYRILGYLGLDDLTYSHLSARLPGSNHYFISPLGLLFCEVEADLLLKVDLSGEVLEGTEQQYNQTGFVIHSSIYEAREEVNAVFHLHAPYSVAVSASESGLLPISQFAFHFYNRLSYHVYDSLALDKNRQGQTLAQDLGQNPAMLLKNHGSISCGKTVQEAFFYIYYLEQACKVQCLASQLGQPLIVPSPLVCEQAAQDMRAFEQDLGMRDWTALSRVLARAVSGSKNIQSSRELTLETTPI